MHNCHRVTARITTVMLGLMLLIGVAHAGVPSAPRNVSTYADGSPGYWGAGLQWERNTDNVDGYNIYLSADGGTTYRRIDAVSDSAGESRYTYRTGRLPNGYYVFYVTAFNADGESAHSNHAPLTLDGIGIKFLDYSHADSTEIGVTVSRAIRAEASNNGTIVYSLNGGAQGMAIDPSTGEFSWTPTAAGYYSVEVVATLASDSRISERTGYNIIVNYRPSDYCVTLSGTVDFDNGNPVGNGWAYATIAGPNGWETSFRGSIDNGRFSMTVPQGTYIVRVSGDDFYAEYYSDAPSPYTAEQISLACNQPRTIAFSVAATPPRHDPDSVFGRVTDAVTGAGIPNVRIQFFRSESGIHFANAQTQSDGRYKVAIGSDSMFIALAVDPSGQYKSIYYGGSETAAGATVVYPRRDTMNVDFQLERALFYPNVVQGRLIDTTGNELFGKITAYRIGANGRLAESIETWARAGRFGFYNMIPGEYVIGGDASDSVHVPGYHVAGGNASLTWTTATRLTIGASDSLDGIDIRLVYMDGFGGTARLRGVILGSGGTIRKDEGAGILGLVPIADATVFAIDAANSVSGYARTDALGRFSITNLKSGAYTVVVDRVGFKPVWEPMNLTEGGETIFDVQLSASTSMVRVAGSTINSLGLFPNPVDRTATLRFNSAAGTAHVTISDLRGEQIVARTINTVDGENRVTIETSELPAGVYLLRVGSQSGNAAIVVTVSH
jgi:hypothetical protein